MNRAIILYEYATMNHHGCDVIGSLVAKLTHLYIAEANEAPKQGPNQ